MLTKTATASINRVSTKIHENVDIGGNAEIGDFVIIGEPPVGYRPGELKTVIGQNAVIRSHTVIYAGNVIGDGFTSGHGALIRETNQIGNDVSVGSHSVIEHHVVIKDRVRVHSNVFIPEFSTLEEAAWIGPNVVMTNAPFPQGAGAKNNLHGAHIQRWAKVGANATLLPGVTIGENALVGAGSVVVRSVGARHVVVGNPARRIKDICDIPAYRSQMPPVSKL